MRALGALSQRPRSEHARPSGRAQRHPVAALPDLADLLRGVPPLILDDQALIAHVTGRGLVVLTGCGHAGVVNICRYAQRLTGIEKLHAVIGGFHLSGPLFEPVIEDTVSALERLAPDVIVPAHCTGWKATHAVARRLPGAFIQNSVGMALCRPGEHARLDRS